MQPGERPSKQDIARAKQILYSVGALQDPFEKKKQLEVAYGLAKNAAEDSLIDAIVFQLAFNANISGDWAKGLEWAMTGMDRIGSDSTSYVFPAFANMIAQSFEKQRDYTAALEWAKKSIRSAESYDHRLFLRENRWAARMVASKYMARLHYPLDSCLHYARESIRLGKLDSIPESLFAYSYMNMAIAFDEYDRRDSAIAYFHRALAVFNENGNIFSAQETERDLATLFLRDNRTDSALYYARKAYEAAPGVNNWDVRMDAANIMSVALENTNKDQSLTYLKEYLHLKDSLFNRDKFSEIALIRTNEQLKARDAAEKERQLRSRIITYSLLAGLVLMAFVGIILHRNNQARKKTNRQLVEKNHELEIESSLEKVRSRSLAMRRSNELEEVVANLFERLKELKIAYHGAGIYLFDKEKRNMVLWIASSVSEPAKVNLPFDAEIAGNIITCDLWSLQEKGEDIRNKRYAGREKDDYYRYVDKYNKSSIPETVRQMMIKAESWTASFAAEEHCALLVDSWEGRNTSNKDFLIVKRFARVFEQAYVRFLDLQKAEAQSREAEIQLGLERLRSRTMAMHKSEELSDAAAVMYQQLSLLGADLWICGFNICHPEKKLVEAWISPPGGQTMEPLYLPIDIDPFTKAGFMAWQEKSGIYTDIDEGQSLKEEHETLLANPVMERPRKYIEENHIVPPDWVQRFAVPYSYGFLTIVSRKEFRETEILQRFATVFDQTYTRFLDLQKAELQARESQVEAALERVRSKTMGMQRSDELLEVVRTMYEQLRILDFQHGAASIIVMHRETGNFDWWLNGFESGYDLPECYRVPYFDHWGHKKPLEYWKKGEKYAEIEISGPDKKTFDAYYFHATDFSKAPEHSKQLMMQQESVRFSMAFTKSGALAWSPSPISSEQASVLQRFATVFDQTYTRFLDLQKAEYQAREAVKQATLDRVRGEIASMRSQEDLARITPLIWAELKHLGIHFSRCGVFIMDTPNHEVNIFLSTPEGKSIAAFDLDFSKINLEEVVEHWKKNEQFVTHWREKEFAALAEILMKEQIIGSPSQYLSDIPTNGLYLHYIPFLQGMLYVAHTASLSQEELNLVQSLADSFSVAYARYEDFTRMEAAKLQTEQALHELKQTQAQLIQAEKMASLGELTAGIAHEIQNPLNFVNNFSDLNKELISELQEELKKGDIREASSIAENLKDNEEKINLHGRRADGIVKSMLQHSRASSGQKESTDVNKLVDEYVRLAYHGYRARKKDFNVTLDIQLDPEVGKVPMVAQDIGRVILNLLNNAFQAVEEKARTAGPEYQPTVSIKTHLGNEEFANAPMRKSVLIRVADNGPGIPDAIKDKIFQPFFTTKPTGQGTGLGLSLSYDIVKAHGGVLTAENNNYAGSSFIIELAIN